MKIKLIPFLLLVSIFQLACVNLEEKTSENHDQTSSEEVNSIETKTTLDIDSITSSIDEYRTQVESELPEVIELSTDSLRAKIKQKWQKIHFYADEGQLKRIKTYPYPEISQRVEEFYVQNGELVLVVIEDQDGEERGKAKSDLDKVYYFHKEEVIKEMKKDSKAEYSVRQSDGEELYTEFEEYLDLFKAMK